ncbi:hypothetical protein J4E08_13520 [Sagittula sp. NFXS13]|uniref:Acyl carrier protein n=1 Tax=Sagittula marina TaxID=943940 RepID=A0A7W6DQK4_9RHOB|nr:phosphopantetheine-binding protein [Sagittula marina]MBB3987381.1 acyl carrier protein [Sagittula marina]
MDDLLKLLNEITTQKHEIIGPQTELIMSGILDSMNIAALIAYIETQTGKPLPIGDLDLMKLGTPDDIQRNFLQYEGA